MILESLILDLKVSRRLPISLLMSQNEVEKDAVCEWINETGSETPTRVDARAAIPMVELIEGVAYKDYAGEILDIDVSRVAPICDYLSDDETDVDLVVDMSLEIDESGPVVVNESESLVDLILQLQDDRGRLMDVLSRILHRAARVEINNWPHYECALSREEYWSAIEMVEAFERS